VSMCGEASVAGQGDEPGRSTHGRRQVQGHHGISSGPTHCIHVRSNRSDRIGASIAHALMVRHIRTDVSGPTHLWSKFGPGLHRRGRGRTTRVSSRGRRPVWEQPRCDLTLLVAWRWHWKQRVSTQRHQCRPRSSGAGR
jgi:hypothetical protein